MNPRSRASLTRGMTITVLVAIALGLGAAPASAAPSAEVSRDVQTATPPAAPAGATGTDAPGNASRDLCRDVFRGAPRGSLVKSTSAGPDGGTVLPGQTITVTLTWKPTDFSGGHPLVTGDCVQVGSEISRVLTQVHDPGPSAAADTFTYVVPSGGTGGQEICDRGVASGDLDTETHGSGRDGGSSWEEDGLNRGQNGSNPGGDGGDQNGGRGHDDGPEKSAILCYTVLGAAAPEATTVLALPLAGLVVFGGAVWVRRRRTGAGSS